MKYVNIYQRDNGTQFAGKARPSRVRADNAAKGTAKHSPHGVRRILLIKVRAK